MITEKEFFNRLKEIRDLLNKGIPIRFNLHEKVRQIDRLIEELLKEAINENDGSM